MIGDIAIAVLGTLVVGEYYHLRVDRVRKEHMKDLRKQIPGYYDDKTEEYDDFFRDDEPCFDVLDRQPPRQRKKRNIVTDELYAELKRTGRTAGRVNGRSQSVDESK